MALSVGDRLPAASFLEMGAEGVRAVASEDLLAGRLVALFGVPGAYTRVCSAQHMPSFVAAAAALRGKGVAEIACVAVNDPFVLTAWGEATGATAAGVRLLGDPSSAFTRAIGMAFDNPAVGFVGRSRRYSMLVENGVVRVLNVEDSPGQCERTAGEALLEAL
jgi:cytochrome c peroxidase